MQFYKKRVMFKRNKKVSKIITVEFVFNEDQIRDWVKGNFQGDLLKKASSKKTSNTVSRSVDVLPHSDSLKSIFFHHRSKRFSNYLDAYELGVFENSNEILGIEWQLRGEYLVVCIILSQEYAKQDDRMVILGVPLSKLFHMQTTGFVPNEQIPGIALSDKYVPRIIEVETDVGGRDDLKKITETFLPGGNGDNLSYRNSLCSVNIYSCPASMNYNLTI